MTGHMLQSGDLQFIMDFYPDEPLLAMRVSMIWSDLLALHRLYPAAWG